jgi:hypothetical protein
VAPRRLRPREDSCAVADLGGCWWVFAGEPVAEPVAARELPSPSVTAYATGSATGVNNTTTTNWMLRNHCLC